jgi:hypothetical protein
MAKQANGIQRALVVNFSQWYDTYTDDTSRGGTKDGQQLRVTATVVTCNADGTHIRGTSYLEDFKHALGGEVFEDMRVRCIADRRDGALQYESQKVEFYHVLTIDASRVKRMAKAIAAIERGLDRAAKLDGWHENSGQYITRVARSIGATRILLLKRYADTRYGDYDANQHQYINLSLGDAVNAINSRMRTWAGGADEQQSQIGY